MNAKQIGLSLLLLDFLGLTAYVVHLYGYVGFLALVSANAAVMIVFADLMIALGLITFWMWQDARDRGWSPLPYALLTLTLGSAGPLLYLIRRAGEENQPAADIAGHPARL